MDTYKKKITQEPGDCCSIDQDCFSPTWVNSLKCQAFLTIKGIWGYTVFIVNHASDYVYVHLMRDFTLEETLLAKRAWEKTIIQ